MRRINPRPTRRRGWRARGTTWARICATAGTCWRKTVTGCAWTFGWRQPTATPSGRWRKRCCDASAAASSEAADAGSGCGLRGRQVPADGGRGPENPAARAHLGRARDDARPGGGRPTANAGAHEDACLSAQPAGAQESGASLRLAEAAGRIEESPPRGPLEDPTSGLPLGSGLQPAAHGEPGTEVRPGVARKCRRATETGAPRHTAPEHPSVLSSNHESYEPSTIQKPRFFSTLLDRGGCHFSDACPQPFAKVLRSRRIAGDQEPQRLPRVLGELPQHLRGSVRMAGHVFA